MAAAHLARNSRCIGRAIAASVAAAVAMLVLPCAVAMRVAAAIAAVLVRAVRVSTALAGRAANVAGAAMFVAAALIKRPGVAASSVAMLVAVLALARAGRYAGRRACRAIARLASYWAVALSCHCLVPPSFVCPAENGICQSAFKATFLDSGFWIILASDSICGIPACGSIACLRRARAA
jgi:hypothetical protein